MEAGRQRCFIKLAEPPEPREPGGTAVKEVKSIRATLFKNNDQASSRMKRSIHISLPHAGTFSNDRSVPRSDRVESRIKN
jgi:hypothetical protein